MLNSTVLSSNDCPVLLFQSFICSSMYCLSPLSSSELLKNSQLMTVLIIFVDMTFFMRHSSWLECPRHSSRTQRSRIQGYSSHSGRSSPKPIPVSLLRSFNLQRNYLPLLLRRRLTSSNRNNAHTSACFTPPPLVQPSMAGNWHWKRQLLLRFYTCIRHG